ncbi:Transglutaminase-like superfamily protein [Ruminococcaceae bacterium YRB3002]|nr:Transglutaminase-like superfamily protein [Ruminococcaceae bacterium YRB3002]
MKKILSCLLCFVIIGLTVTSCSSKEPSDTTASETAVSTEITPAVTEDTSAETSESEESEETVRWFTFNPKVSSSFMLDVYGQAKCDAWSSLVDAVMEGRDTFSCVDKHTYLWMMADFPDRYFPVLNDIIKTPDNYLDIEVNGTAPIEYKVSKDEAARMIEKFTTLVEDIINGNIKPEYNDFEKALALYNYFTVTYVYDYDTARLVDSNPSQANYTSSYRLLTQKTGICCEIAKAYSYLLMQLGMDATTVTEGKHEWSLIKLGGNYYHVDPTWVLEDWYSLRYFLMTDDQRHDQGGYNRKDFKYVGDYSPEEMPDYSATDDSFSSMWECHVTSFDPETKTLKYTESDDDGREISGTFDYSAFCN